MYLWPTRLLPQRPQLNWPLRQSCCRDCVKSVENSSCNNSTTHHCVSFSAWQSCNNVLHSFLCGRPSWPNYRFCPSICPSVRLSVCLSVWCMSVCRIQAPNSKTKKRRKTEIGQNVTQGMSNWCVNFQLKRSNVKSRSGHRTLKSPENDIYRVNMVCGAAMKK